LIWVFDPDAKSVTGYTGSLRGKVYCETEILEGGEVIPGFRCRIAEFFN